MNKISRARKWALTINENAPCYTNLGEKIASIIGSGDRYAYILHDKDFNVDNDTGEVIDKHKHIHLLISFKNARGFESMRKTFEGAHVEKALGESAFANYLLHNGKPDKYKYKASEVITSDKEWYESLLQENDKPTFIEDRLPYYIYVLGLNTYLKLCLEFGASQLPYNTANKMDRLIQDYRLLNDSERLEIVDLLEKTYNDSDKRIPF